MPTFNLIVCSIEFWVNQILIIMNEFTEVRFWIKIIFHNIIFEIGF
jgi:hypothetical protein